ncbi:MAG TPA: elongation factor G [Rhizomicrobium sp.]|nr:elongation factor G [Rhizomicrobium sp.]
MSQGSTKEKSTKIKATPRAIALVGPHGGGKTSLLESIAIVTGAAARKGSVPDGSSLGDHAPESRARGMSVEMNVLTAHYLGEEFVFLDCPGSIEFLGDTLNILPGIDAAIVVCEPDAAKVMMLQPVLKRLSDAAVPHLLFVNKIDKARGPLRAFMAALQAVSDRPLLLRQIPIWENGVATGFVDLALERAFSYRPHDASEVVDIADYAREKEARFQMLEKLADYDEQLMEELLGDVEPPPEEVFGDLKREVGEGLVVPVLIGSAEGDNGVRRLLKCLRHDAPEVTAAAKRAGMASGGDAVVQILKTFHGGHGGKLSLARLLRGQLKDGAVLHGMGGREARIGGIFALAGDKQIKRGTAQAGDTVALARLEPFVTGEILSTVKTGGSRAALEKLPPVYRLAVAAPDRKDEVKLSGAIAKLCEEDPSLVFEQNSETHDMILGGQGEIHLKVAVEKLRNRFGLTLTTQAPRVPYRETIRKTATARGRHKRQTGGHGQFGDVLLEIVPAPRGSKFTFIDRIKGGVVPKQWIGSVEKGVLDYMKAGPLGFPVVDVVVALIDGSYHTVDSSDAAFQTAGRLAMSEGMPGCAPVLLEPIMQVRVHVPSEATAKVNSLVSGRRGTLCGFDARAGWRGWDTVQCEMPLSEVSDLIVDLRSLTQGVGTYEMAFDRLSELDGKLADSIVATRKAA